MSNGRHFTPPTPAFRPVDPFAPMVPRSAERVPSCETTQPLPSRVRPVRVDTSAPSGVVAEPPARLRRLGPQAPRQPRGLPMPARKGV